MRIDPKVVTPPITRETRDAQPSVGQPPKADDAAGGSASVVKLSAAGTAASEVDSASATTTSRLQTIRAMLDKGDYPVDLDMLASRIVDDELIRAGKS